MNIAFSDITEECALELVHLVHSYCGMTKTNNISAEDMNSSLRTYPRNMKDEILIPFAKTDRRNHKHIECNLVHTVTGETHHFDSLREAMRFLGMDPTGMSRRFAENMIVRNWKFVFEK